MATTGRTSVEIQAGDPELDAVISALAEAIIQPNQFWVQNDIRYGWLIRVMHVAQDDDQRTHLTASCAYVIDQLLDHSNPYGSVNEAYPVGFGKMQIWGTYLGTQVSVSYTADSTNLPPAVSALIVKIVSQVWSRLDLSENLGRPDEARKALRDRYMRKLVSWALRNGRWAHHTTDGGDPPGGAGGKRRERIFVTATDLDQREFTLTITGESEQDQDGDPVLAVHTLGARIAYVPWSEDIPQPADIDLTLEENAGLLRKIERGLLRLATRP